MMREPSAEIEMPPTSEISKAASELPQELALPVAPLHKRVLGVAFAVATAFVVFALTLVHLVRSPDEVYPLVLLSQYFAGYEVSVKGAFIGAAWGFAVGFVGGWFFAFARNLIVGIMLVVVRARAEIADSSQILDHI